MRHQHLSPAARFGSTALAAALLLGTPALVSCGDAIQQGAEQIAEGAVGGNVDITDEGVTIEGEDGENLAMGSFLRKDRDGVAQDLERVFVYFPRLKERIDQPAGSLSGGEQQMLAISRALMNRPKLLLLDEPSLGLSPLLVEEMFALIQRINREGQSILLMEQNAVQTLAIAHRGYIIENGRVAMQGVASELARDPELRKNYLGL